jgi:hypothetical protein
MSNAKDPSAVTTGHVMQPNGRPRPMSPHLQVWRWHVTMLASILTRVTGGALYVGALLVVAWIAALASGAEAYDAFVRRWNTAQRLRADTEGFRADANDVLRRLHARMQRENREFYPRIEALA